MDLKLKKRHISAKQKSGTYPMMGQRRFQYIQKLCTKVLMAVKCIYYETHHFNFIYLFIDRVLQCGSHGLEFIISLLWDYKHVPPSQDNFTT